MAETIVPKAKPGGPLVTNIVKLKLLGFSHILVLYFALSEVAVCIPIKYLGNLMKQKQEDAETEMRHLSHSQMLFVNYCEQRSNKRDNYANFNHIWTQIHILLYHYVIRSHPYIT